MVRGLQSEAVEGHQMTWSIRRSGLILFMALVAGLCFGAVLSLSGLPLR
jgi:hypothetical protein